MRIDELDTPVLLIDSDALERNLQRLAKMTKAAGIDYRPHTKTHKSATIARMQVEAGAIGVCCAKLGEAEVMAANEIDNIFHKQQRKNFHLLYASVKPISFVSNKINNHNNKVT